ncbi:MAG: GDP-mannose 4,6-dehydratase [Singulisphaera sp.]
MGGTLAEHLIRSDDLVSWALGVGAARPGGWRTCRPGPDRAVRPGRGRRGRAGRADRPQAARGDLPPGRAGEPAGQHGRPRGTWALNLGGTPEPARGRPEVGPGARVVWSARGQLRQPAPEHLPVTESCPMRPNNPYSSSKAAADLLGVQHALEHGADVVIVRPFNHAGPRQSSRYVLGALALQVAEVELGRKARVEVGNLDVVRDFTDVRDVVRGYRLLALAGRGDAGEIYNLGSGRGTKLADAVAILTSLARVPIEVHVDPARVRPVDLPLLVADPSKLRAATGWEPCISIEQTLADMLQDWRDTLVREDHAA